MTITERIRNQIEATPVGEPFTTAAFLKLGSRAAVDQVLHRLTQAGQICRISRGVYVRPKISPYVGQVLPEPYEVARAIAQSMGATLQVHGAEAARHFGLSTQVPTQAVYYTSGATRHARLGKLNVILKHAEPRKMALAERAAGMALSALRYLGREHVNPGVIEIIREKLPCEEFQALRGATYAMPGWLSDAFYQHEREFNLA